ncbi:MAG: MBL fold metallo-hydrolase [Bacteroidales bacterium]|nr:MBL fold metallo-hydrolase [Bacteroidales bacterium]
MKCRTIPCGYLNVKAVEMIKPLGLERISLQYEVDKNKYMRLSMNALLVEKGGRKVLFDPGAAGFLPLRIQREYGLEIPVPLEELLSGEGLEPGQITDVVFTHLHFDHASGGFKRVQGNIVKRFPHARYHVLKEHYDYALNPDPMEADSFCTELLKYLDRIHWLEEWDLDGIEFMVFNGHTRGMAVPVIGSGKERTCFVSDLIPMAVFLENEVWCGYDLEPTLQLAEKQEFLQEQVHGLSLFLYHETLEKKLIG